jgi:hypothetical protein
LGAGSLIEHIGRPVKEVVTGDTIARMRKVYNHVGQIEVVEEEAPQCSQMVAKPNPLERSSLNMDEGKKVQTMNNSKAFHDSNDNNSITHGTHDNQGDEEYSLLNEHNQSAKKSIKFADEPREEESDS